MKGGTPFFSIVVPCCNVARYLDEMAASVKAQSFADWECILSYEDSSDGTLAACEALVKSDPRFRLVVCGPRSGSPATPRNRAFKQVRGEYVGWLDGDDFLADDVLAVLAKAIADAGEPCDLIQGGVTEFLEDDQGGRSPVGRHFNFTSDDDGCVFSGVDALCRMLQNDYVWPMASFSICRADFLRTSGTAGGGVSFADGRIYEDEEWTPRAIALASRVLVVNRDFCHYRRHVGSITHRTDENLRLAHYALVARSQFLFFAGMELPRDAARVIARYYVSRFIEVFFEPHPVSPPVSLRRLTESFRQLLGGRGRAALWKLAHHASFAKRAGIVLLMVAGIHPLLDLPARLYFDIYYRLVLWRVRRRGA